MAIDFPTSKYTVADGTSQNSWPGSPSSGDTATANSYTYTYNGTLWVMNNGSTKSFTGGATYTWDGEKWDASNIPNNSNVVQAPSSGWANGELLQYNGTTWDSVDLIIDEDNMSSDSDTKIPTQQSVKSYVDNQVASVVDSAPATLDTLNELAAALGDDANFSTTVSNSIGTKLPLSGGTMTGNIVMSGSQTVDGRDLSADGAKLDGIASGAQVNVATNLSQAADENGGIEIRSSTGTNTTIPMAAAATQDGLMSKGDKAKLNGIAVGAEVNVMSDWNATIGDAAILNKPTIPSATSDLTNDSGFITADATKLPLAGGTMSGDIAMGSNKVTGLGTPSATGDAATKGYVDTQISASGGGTVTNVSGTAPISVTNGTTTPAISITAATTSAAGTMSSSDKSKLDGIAAGAEVNVQSDWNASSGDAAILNKPTIPTNNNQLTNGAGYITSADGGNADTVDSLHATSFVRTDQASTITSGNLTLSSGDIIVNNGTNNSIHVQAGDGSIEISRNGGGAYIDFKNLPSEDNDVRIQENGGNLEIGGHRILTTADEGIGNGLDADTLDSLHASSFLRSDADDSASGALTIKGAVYTDYTSSNTDITGLVSGSTFGSLIQPTASAHLIVGLRENDPADSFSVISGGGNWSADNTYDKLVFAAKANGDLFAGSNKIWHAGNDGPGSGLDADTLDGQHGSHYLNYNNLTNKPTIPSAYGDSNVDSHLNRSSASSGDSLTWNGSDYAWSAPSGGGGGADVQEFTSSGTWTKPSGCSIVEVHVFGAAGGGGGGGTTNGTVTASTSGNVFLPSGGGSGGSYVSYTFEASDLGSTVSVTVGAGGTGGSGTNSTTVYNHGSVGGNSSFGTLLAYGGHGGPSAALVPDHYDMNSSSIKSSYNYALALDAGLRRPAQRFPFWYHAAFPNYQGIDSYGDGLLPTAGGNGGGSIDYLNNTYLTQGLGSQGMFQAFVSTGMTGITASRGINAGAANAYAGTWASNKFQSGNGGRGRNSVSAAIMNGGNGGSAAGGGGGGSSINVSMSGGDGGTGGNGYVIVRSW